MDVCAWNAGSTYRNESVASECTVRNAQRVCLHRGVRIHRCPLGTTDTWPRAPCGSIPFTVAFRCTRVHTWNNLWHFLFDTIDNSHRMAAVLTHTAAWSTFYVIVHFNVTLLYDDIRIPEELNCMVRGMKGCKSVVFYVCHNGGLRPDGIGSMESVYPLRTPISRRLSQNWWYTDWFIVRPDGRHSVS